MRWTKQKSCGYAQRKIQRQEGDIVRFYSQKRLPPYFYTEAEKIFEMIANTIDKRVPSGMRWHAELLTQMTLNNSRAEIAYHKQRNCNGA